MEQDIRSNPIAFQNSFLSEVAPTKVESDYGAVLRVLLFYIWRGCSLSRKAGVTGKADPKACLLSLAVYEATLSILQLIRIGYQADAAILLRGLMERIAIVGYLGDNKDHIPRYFESNQSPYKEALSWAKKNSLQNWMILYSTLSGVAHSRVEGLAGHIHNCTHIGNAFREIPTRDPASGMDMTEELIGLVVYSLIALDPLALSLIEDRNSQPFPTDTELIQNVGYYDAKDFRNFLQRLVDRYTKLSHPQTSAPNTGSV